MSQQGYQGYQSYQGYQECQGYQEGQCYSRKLTTTHYMSCHDQIRAPKLTRHTVCRVVNRLGQSYMNPLP